MGALVEPGVSWKIEIPEAPIAEPNMLPPALRPGGLSTSTVGPWARPSGLAARQNTQVRSPIAGPPKRVLSRHRLMLRQTPRPAPGPARAETIVSPRIQPVASLRGISVLWDCPV